MMFSLILYRSKRFQYMTAIKEGDDIFYKPFWNFQHLPDFYRGFYLNITKTKEKFEDALPLLKSFADSNDTTAQFLLAEHFTFNSLENSKINPFEYMETCYKLSFDLCGDFLAYYYDRGLFTKQNKLKSKLLLMSQDSFISHLVRSKSLGQYERYLHYQKIFDRSEYLSTEIIDPPFTEIYRMSPQGIKFGKYIKKLTKFFNVSNNEDKTCFEYLRQLKDDHTNIDTVDKCVDVQIGGLRDHFAWALIKYNATQSAVQYIIENNVENYMNWALDQLFKNQTEKLVNLSLKIMEKNEKYWPLLAKYYALAQPKYNDEGDVFMKYFTKKYFGEPLTNDLEQYTLFYSRYQDFKLYLGAEIDSKEDDVEIYENKVYSTDNFTKFSSRIKLAFKIDDVYKINNLLSITSPDPLRIFRFVKIVRYVHLMLITFITKGYEEALSLYNVPFIKTEIDLIISISFLIIMFSSFYLLVKKRAEMTVFD